MKDIDKNELYRFLHLKMSPMCRTCCYYKYGMGFILESYLGGKNDKQN